MAVGEVMEIFNPYKWIAAVVLVLSLVAGAMWGVHKYNDGIREEAVAAALKDERATTQPVIDELSKRVADRDDTIEAKDKAFKTEQFRQTEVAAHKQKLYNNLIAQNATLSKLQNTAIASPEFVANGVRELTAAGSDSACAGDSDDRRRLGAAIAQCETDLNRQLRATDTAVDIATKALAAARALRN